MGLHISMKAHSFRYLVSIYYLDALITACAPARRAAGTRNGEQDT